MDGFYASVELLAHPELKHVPVAVCGNPENRHGIILAKNTLAKKYHVKTAETVWQAKKKCPELHLLPPHHYKYKEYSLAGCFRVPQAVRNRPANRRYSAGDYPRRTGSHPVRRRFL